MKKHTSFFEKVFLFFSPLKQDRKIYIIGLIMYLFWGVDRVVHVLFLERFVSFLEIGDAQKFFSVFKYYLLYILLYFSFTFAFRKRSRTEISYTVIKYIQRGYLNEFLKIENNYIEKQGTGKLTAIINNGLDKWGRLLDIFLNQSITLLVSFIFTLYMLNKVGSYFVFIFCLVYFTLYFIAYFLNLGALKYRRKRRDFGNYHTKNLVKVIMNKQEILQSDKINHELKILEGYKDKEIFYNKKMSNYLYFLFEGPNILLALTIVTLFFYLGNLYFSGEIKLSLIVGLVSALILMQGAVEKGIIFFKDFTKEFVDIEKLWDFFDNAPKYTNLEEGKSFIYKNGDVEFKNVSYHYIEGKNILEKFFMKIKGGDITALVGESGGGKTTIAKLVGGYISVKEGNLIIDGQDISELSLKSYYGYVGFLTQDPSVFDGTVLENLEYSFFDGVLQKNIEEIIKLSQCDFIYDLPNGLDTQIGERGVKLSGGQKQRLAIAKLMLKDPKILILDEPTSALDSFSEEKITKAMKKLFEGRTVLVIAHRLQTVKHAHKIFVIDKGKIVEDGTHNELIKKKGRYNKMLELQSGF